MASPAIQVTQGKKAATATRASGKRRVRYDLVAAEPAVSVRQADRRPLRDPAVMAVAEAAPASFHLRSFRSTEGADQGASGGSTPGNAGTSATVPGGGGVGTLAEVRC